MSTNVEINVMQDNGQYETIYPQTITQNIVDLNNVLENYFTKNQTLQEDVALLFGDTVTTPNDIFQFLSKFNQYWWKKTGTNYEIIYTPVVNNPVLCNGTNFIQYSKSIQIDNTGQFYFDTYGTIQLSTTNSANLYTLANNAPVYVKSTDNQYYYIPENPTVGVNSNDTLYNNSYGTYFGSNAAIKASSISTSPNITESYVYSSNQNEYPVNGDQDGFNYLYIGIPFENIITIPKIVLGSYVGTGTYGINSPNIIQADFPIKFIWIYGYRELQSYQQFNILGYPSYGTILPISVLTTNYSQYTSFYSVSSGRVPCYTKKNENSQAVYWYEPNSANYQFNDNNYRYFYVLFG